MTLVQLELGGVFDRDDSVLVRDRGRECVQESCLPRARAAADEDVELGVYAALEVVDGLSIERSDLDHLVESQPFLAELSDRDQRPAEAERGNDDVDAAAVRQARIDHRRGLVDAPSHLRDDLVDDPAHVRLVIEAHVGVEEPTVALDPDVVGAVDHDLGDAVVGQQPLERAVAERIVGDRGGEALLVVARDARLIRQVALDVDDHAVTERHRVHADVEQLWSELSDHC